MSKTPKPHKNPATKTKLNLRKLLEGSAVWLALGFAVLLIGGTVTGLAWLETYVDRRVAHYTLQHSPYSKQLTSHGYILLTRAVEREFIDIVANTPGVALPGSSQVAAKATIEAEIKSLETLEKDLPPHERQPTRLLLVAYIHLMAGKGEEALESLDKYDGPNLFVKRYLRGLAFTYSKKPDLANVEYDGVLTLTDTKFSERRLKAKAQNNKGNLAARSKVLQKALEHYDMALKIDPSLYGVYINRADVLAELNNVDEAFKSLCIARTSYGTGLADLVIFHRDTLAPPDKRTLVDLLGGGETVRTRLNNCA